MIVIPDGRTEIANEARMPTKSAFVAHTDSAFGLIIWNSLTGTSEDYASVGIRSSPNPHWAGQVIVVIFIVAQTAITGSFNFTKAAEESNADHQGFRRGFKVF